MNTASRVMNTEATVDAPEVVCIQDVISAKPVRAVGVTCHMLVPGIEDEEQKIHWHLYVNSKSLHKCHSVRHRTLGAMRLVQLEVAHFIVIVISRRNLSEIGPRFLALVDNVRDISDSSWRGCDES